MPRRRDRVDELLSGGRLSGPARDRVLQRVLEDLPEAEPRTRLRRAAPLLGAAAALGAVVLVVVRLRSGGLDHLRAKGGASPVPAAVVTPLCPRAGGECRPGDRLLFRVEASPHPGFLMAYADLITGDAAASARIWIFPTAAGDSPEIPATAAPLVLRRAVEIDASFPAGRYRVTTVVAARPLTRAEVPVTPDAGREVTTLVVE